MTGLGRIGHRAVRLRLAELGYFVEVLVTVQGVTLSQIHPVLEVSFAIGGASLATSFRRIILLLLKPGLLAGWIYVMIVSIRELSTSILLYSPDTQVVSIVVWELWENGQYVELSALGVLFIITLFVLVLIAQWLGRKYGVKE
jgi:iron(III) transport system permease protein